MSDDNLSASSEPVQDTSAPLDMDSAIAGLSGILKDDDLPEQADPVEENEEQEQAADVEADDAEAEAEDVEQEDAEDEDGSEEPEIKGGRFAPDTAKVTLDDGSVITVADLKRNNLFQRDYTKKTTELKAEREAFDAERQEVSQFAQSLAEFRDYVAWYAEQNMPKPPEQFKGDPANDPMGYMQWQHQMQQWQQHQQAYQVFQQNKEQEGQKKAGESHAQMQARLQTERDNLFNAWPVLKDPEKGKQAWDGLVNGATQYYGIQPDEVNGLVDHRQALILRDALAYRKLKDAAPTVKADVRKPALQDGRRASSKAPTQQRVQSERFNQTRSIDDAVAVLKTLNL
jgi:hypothetical protein